MTCTHCKREISKGQPYARTKRGPHHFRPRDCKPSPIEHVETLWACACGFKWFSTEEPQECPSCKIKAGART